MPLFDTKTLDNDFAGSTLLASVLFATPEAKADALARGRERLARAGSVCEAMTQTGSRSGGSRRALPERHVA